MYIDYCIYILYVYIITDIYNHIYIYIIYIYIYIYINWQKQLFEDFFNGKKSIRNSVCQ